MKLATSVISIILLLVASVFGDEPERIILYKRDGIVVKLLRGDGYGYMFINDGVREGKSIPRYILAIEESRTVIDTKDLKVFRAVLATLPKGIGISHYSTCGLPMAFGLNDEDSNRFIRVFRNSGLQPHLRQESHARAGNAVRSQDGQATRWRTTTQNKAALTNPLPPPS